jgi:Nuclear transport factor 2 (NTF2) domain
MEKIIKKCFKLFFFFFRILDIAENLTFLTRVLNKDYDRLGRIYAAQYYSLFDDPKKRLSLVSLYHSEDSFLTFEGEEYRGTKNILRKFEKLKLGALTRKILSVDTQPLLDGGVIISVVGKVHDNDKPDNLYAQIFVYKPQKGSFFLQHDIFRVIRQ